MSQKNIPQLSIIILTKNEEANLSICLDSLKNLDAEIFVIDCGSNDRTVEIAEQFGCQIFEHPFENQAQQLNWALENIPIKTHWIMRLDADERLMPELVTELQEVLLDTLAEITGDRLPVL